MDSGSVFALARAEADLESAVRRRRRAFALAIELGDPTAYGITRELLERAVNAAEVIKRADSKAGSRELKRALALLALAKTPSGACDLVRAIQWMESLLRDNSRAGLLDAGPDLFRVRAARHLLAFVSCAELQLRDCDFHGASFARTSFFQSKVVNCDFTNAALDSSDWGHATIERGTFRGAQFINALLDATRFFRCDLRDSTIGKTRIGSHGVHFIECDLRGCGRRLGRNATFIRCNLDEAVS